MRIEKKPTYGITKDDSQQIRCLRHIRPNCTPLRHLSKRPHLQHIAIRHFGLSFLFIEFQYHKNEGKPRNSLLLKTIYRFDMQPVVYLFQVNKQIWKFRWWGREKEKVERSGSDGLKHDPYRDVPMITDVKYRSNN